MKTSSLALIVIAIVIVVSLVAVWFYPSLNDFMASNAMWNGIKAFTNEFQVADIDSLDNLGDKTGNNILISIPYTPYNDNDLAAIKQFVNDGNTLILMDDFGYGNSILEYLGTPIRFNHNIVLDPLFCYKNEYFPRITDFSSDMKEQGIKAVAFNHATVLDQVNESQALAWSSSSSFLDINKNGVKDKNEPAGPFAVAAEFQVGKGTVKLVSDPSIIINTMVEQNDNHQFTRYLIERNGNPESIILDRSHLSKTPLDSSKIGLQAVRNFMSNPYIMIGLIALIFVIVTRFTLKKGELLD